MDKAAAAAVLPICHCIYAAVTAPPLIHIDAHDMDIAVSENGPFNGQINVQFNVVSVAFITFAINCMPANNCTDILRFA